MPSAEQVAAIFKPLGEGNPPAFFAAVDENVEWNVKGSFVPIAGEYKSLQAFHDGTKALSSTWATPLRLVVQNIVSDGGYQAAVELKAVDVVCRSGLRFTNEYTWVCTFGKSGKIVKINAYMDTDLVSRAIKENPMDKS